MKQIAAFVRCIDRLNDAVGRGASWLTLLMVLIAFMVVVLRYVFAVGWVWMQESYIWLNGVIFMVAAAYTLLHDEHVRVDIFYKTASPRYKAWVDLGGALLLLLPMIAVVAATSEIYIVESWRKLEGSGEAGGLPGLFIMKSMIWAFCLLIGLQGLALAGRSILLLGGGIDGKGRG